MKGSGIKCDLQYCVAQKMSLHRGAVSTEPGLKKTLKADGEFTKNDKKHIMSPTQGDGIVCARLIVLNCCCVPSIQM